MSLLQDPFDLLKAKDMEGQEMENVVPFLAQPNIDMMVEAALKHQQLPAKKSYAQPLWKFGGVAIAACMALFMVFLTPESGTVTQRIDTHSVHAAAEDVGEFGELVMLDTLESY